MLFFLRGGGYSLGLLRNQTSVTALQFEAFALSIMRCAAVLD